MEKNYNYSVNAALKKNSSNSSKPPSSDIVKPKPQKDKERRRKIGAQKGHKQHLRKPIAPELVDEVIKLELTECPDGGHPLDLANIEPKTTQQIELVEIGDGRLQTAAEARRRDDEICCRLQTAACRLFERSVRFGRWCWIARSRRVFGAMWAMSGMNVFGRCLQLVGDRV